MQRRNVYGLLPFLLGLFVNSALAQEPQFNMNAVGANNFLESPWDLEYGPDGYLWVTEREKGIVLRVNPETAERDELVDIEEVYSSSRQEGLLGMALDKNFELGSPYVYLSYTYLDGEKYQRLVRYTYEITAGNGTLSSPITILEKLPASNDHNSGRLIVGPDGKLYYTIGDLGANQNRNYCNLVLSQNLPSQEEIDQQNWTNYPGKVLRLNTDGSIPDDNPPLNGVRSHIFSYGHRNAQGIVFGANGLLYSDEHGPNTDDEVNIIYAGKNYGWPFVVGFRDDQAYDYCNWSSLENCSSVGYDGDVCPDNADVFEESEFTEANYQEPLASMFAVGDDYNFDDPRCSSSWFCRPNVAPSSIGIYESDAIPSWKNSLLVTSLKRGQIYRYQLDESGTSIMGDITIHFYSANRYRDVVVHPDGKTIFFLTDDSGRTSTADGLSQASSLRNPGNILQFSLLETTTSQSVDLNSPVKVYPNPSSQHIRIAYENLPGSYEAELVEVTGRVVKRVSYITSRIQEVSTQDISPGVYILRVTSARGTWQERLILK
ncbi:MAG: glucose/sorbosone family PQQ-dependent dehydrogenase [Bacteroidota bacterium]